MRRIVGYTPERRAVWSDNVPSSAYLATVRGEIVQGQPDAVQRQRAQAGAEKRRKAAAS